MKYLEAVDVATKSAAEFQVPFGIWEHVGGGPVGPSGRWIVRPEDKTSPHRGWVKRTIAGVDGSVLPAPSDAVPLPPATDDRVVALSDQLLSVARESGASWAVVGTALARCLVRVAVARVVKKPETLDAVRAALVTVQAEGLAEFDAATLPSTELPA